MAAHSPLRRWKPFFAAFGCIDDAVQAADPDLSRDDFRRARGQLVEMLCDATDDAQAEGLCRLLDEVMAESLVTLQLVPVMPKMLASNDLAKAVGALRKHQSKRVRGLASGIFRGWRASVEDDLARVRAAMEKLDQIPQPEETEQHVSSDADAKMKHPTRILETSPKKVAAVVGSDRVKTAKISEPSLPKKRAPAVGSGRVKTAKISEPSLPKKRAPAVGSGRVKTAKISEPSLPKKRAPAVGSGRVKMANMDASTEVPQPLPKVASPVVRCADGASVRSCSDQKMEAAKRKLREGYQEAEHAKRQRRIHVIEAPEMVRQRQRKMHPIMRVRSRVSCVSSMAERSFLMSSLQRV